MALLSKQFQVITITDSEILISSQNFNRTILYLKNRGSEPIYIAKKSLFDIDTESLKLSSSEVQIWTDKSCPAEAFYAKCQTGLTSVLEIEEV